jgi:hypothetical protein
MFFFVGISVTVLNSANVKQGKNGLPVLRHLNRQMIQSIIKGIQVVFSGVYFRNSQMQIPNPANRILLIFTGYREKKVGLTE